MGMGEIRGFRSIHWRRIGKRLILDRISQGYMVLFMQTCQINSF